ncbi:MAG: hypothetical protein VX874_04080 [Pseudomonadota bacterium]|nr:hypothetical protein [Pseudomonadota bacterium]
MRAALAVTLLVLAGCGATTTGGMAPARQGVSFTPDATGLSVDGTGQRMDFGRSPRGMIPVLERELGSVRELPLAGCPAGVVQQLDWDGLILTFTPERFVGWKQAGQSAGQSCA